MIKFKLNDKYFLYEDAIKEFNLMRNKNIGIYDTALPDEIEILNITNNEDIHIDNLKLPKNIKHIKITDNKFTTFMSVSFPDYLESFNFSNNVITFMSQIKFPVHCKELLFANTKISDFNKIILSHDVEVIDLSNTGLPRMDFDVLPKTLKKLKLSQNSMVLKNMNVLQDLTILELRNVSFNDTNVLHFSANLKTIDMTYSKVTNVKMFFPEGLKRLNLSFTDFSDVVFPSTLETLILDGNKITDTQLANMNLDKLTRLTKLSINSNKLIDLSNFKYPPAIQSLNIGHNDINSLQGASFPEGINTIDIGFNKITTLNGVLFPDTLEHLNVESNRMTSFPLSILPIRIFRYAGNPIEINALYPAIARKLSLVRNNIKTKSLYEDKQNVHSSDIQNSIKKIIWQLPHDKKIVVPYKCVGTEIHEYYGISPYDAVQMVMTYPKYNKEILDEAINDGYYGSNGGPHCLTGRIGRIINSLSGIHPDVMVTVSELTQANEIAIHFMKNKKTKKEFIAELKSREIKDEIILELAGYYEDPNDNDDDDDDDNNNGAMVAVNNDGDDDNNDGSNDDDDNNDYNDVDSTTDTDNDDFLTHPIVSAHNTNVLRVYPRRYPNDEQGNHVERVDVDYQPAPYHPRPYPLPYHNNDFERVEPEITRNPPRIGVFQTILKKIMSLLQ
jgi:hypothetical protein